MKKIAIYDTTLRDGMQGEGLSISCGGKLRLTAKFDEFGIDYVEGGYAGSNLKDMDFFREVRKLNLANTKVAAFGNTRRAGVTAAEDTVTRKIIESQASVATIFGKSWMLHVRDVLRTTAEENLAMVRDTVRILKEAGREVIFDAEHFFDGYRDSPEYAFKVLKVAAEAGADCVVLCDTNGGSMPNEIYEITRATCRAMGRLAVGIHCHNDAGMGVANSIEAVRAGAVHVQGTANGYGERCGNANLYTIIPALELKMGCRCLPEGSLRGLTGLSRFVDGLLNLQPDRRAPYVGESAFAHKAGMHVNAVHKNPRSFEHIQPEDVATRGAFWCRNFRAAAIFSLKLWKWAWLWTALRRKCARCLRGSNRKSARATSSRLQMLRSDC